MSEAEYLISSRARTLSKVQKRKIRRGRRPEPDSSSLSGGSEITPGHPINQHMIKIFNDMQAFQQSGLLNNNLSYASSTPMVNNMTVLSKKDLKKPTINPRLIDHIFHNHLRIHDDLINSVPSSPQQISPLLAAVPRPVLAAQIPPPALSPNFVTRSPTLHNNVKTQHDITSVSHGNAMTTVSHGNAMTTVSHGNTMTTVSHGIAMTTAMSAMNHATNTTQSTDSRQYFHFPDVSQEARQVYPSLAGHVSKHSSPCDVDNFNESAKLKEKHVHYGEMPFGRYIVGNNKTSGYFEPANQIDKTRQVKQKDHDLVTFRGQNEHLSCAKNQANQEPQPATFGTNYGNWREEYHELTKLSREENSKETFSIAKSHDKPRPHISEIVPYAKLQPSPLSSSPGSSIKNSPILSTNRRQPQNESGPGSVKNGPKVVSRQQRILPSSNENLSEIDHGQVIVRNNRLNRYVDSAKKLSYIKEQDSSMSGESLDISGPHKFGSSKGLKRSTELDVQEENEVILDEDYNLPELVKEIFSDMNEAERRRKSTESGPKTASKRSPAKKTSLDSGNPPSDSSEASKPKTLPRKDAKSTLKPGQRVKKNSPQLEAVRKMDAMRKTGQNTRKYDASVEDEEGTATLTYDKKTKSWKLEMKSAVNAQLFIQELNKKVAQGRKSREEGQVSKRSSKEVKNKTKTMTENVDFVVGGTEKPFVPILDPRAHALTDAECSPMIQPIQHRYPGSSNCGTNSGIHLAPTKKPTHVGYPPEDQSADDSSVSGHRVESPQYETPKFPDETPDVVQPCPEVAIQHYTKQKRSSNSRGRKEMVLTQTSTDMTKFRNQNNHPAQQLARMKTTGQNSNRNVAVTNVSLTVNATINANLSPKLGGYPQPMGYLNPQYPSPLMSPSNLAHQEEHFIYGDDGSFPRSPGCEVGCMPCLVTPHAKLLKEIGPRAEDTESLLPALPAPVPASASSQVLDPNWELSSSGSDEESLFTDEEMGLISRRKSSADSAGILDTFADRFMQFLEENKNSEGMLGNAAKFLIEKAEEHSLDSGNSAQESSEEEPYVPQRKKIADDTLLALFKKEEHRKKEEKKKGCVNPEDQKRMSEVEYLIKTKPMSFDPTSVIYEVDYQGTEANSVARSEHSVNGAGSVRNAPPPQFNSLAELTNAKKQAAIQKHREWEVKKAARMGVPVEALRNSDGINSPGSVGSQGNRKQSRTKRKGSSDRKRKT
ncbi:hypothetical protein ACHWQZ_G009743 [Mnemiopsis leidyi]